MALLDPPEDRHFLPGDLEECKFAEQLNVMKKSILNGAKVMAMSRYKKLGKIDWNGGKKKYDTAATLTLWDSVSGDLSFIRFYHKPPQLSIVGA